MSRGNLNFDAINTSNNAGVIKQVNQATSTRGQQGTASPQEAKERRSKMKTQGRKGVKAVRINMAFSDDNYDYIALVAPASGKTMTLLVNEIIADYRKNHPEVFEKAMELRNIIAQTTGQIEPDEE